MLTISISSAPPGMLPGEIAKLSNDIILTNTSSNCKCFLLFVRNLYRLMRFKLRNYHKTQFVILSAAKNLLFLPVRPFASLRVTVLR